MVVIGGEDNYNYELMAMFGELDIASIIRPSRLRWIGHGRMVNDRQVHQICYNQPEGKINKRYGHTAHTFSLLLSDILI